MALVEVPGLVLEGTAGQTIVFVIIGAAAVDAWISPQLL
jgi:hypothetical protein